MANFDVSDVSQSSVNRGGALALPIRLQKKVYGKTGTASPSDYSLLKAKKAYTDYILIRIPGRGGTSNSPTANKNISLVINNNSNYDPASSAVYRFLINPRDINISRQTLDEQAQSRAGWQIGLKGEDFIDIQISGKTPGRYFTAGLGSNYAGDDHHFPGSESYRNLVALELFYENNGYWYEGEVAGVKQSTKQIKAHSDVELSVGEFVWQGMFTSMSVSDSAQNPAFSDFKLGFAAWREAFNADSPYQNSIGGARHLGHYPPVPLAPRAVTQGTVSYANPTTSVVDDGFGNTLPGAPNDPIGSVVSNGLGSTLPGAPVWNGPN